MWGAILDVGWGFGHVHVAHKWGILSRFSLENQAQGDRLDAWERLALVIEVCKGQWSSSHRWLSGFAHPLA